jgi:hypothetical protein
MALIDNLKDAVRAVPEPDLTGYAFIVATQAQVDAMKADTYRADAPDVALYRPDGTRASRAALTGNAALLGVPVLVREVGADISDIPTPVLDLRSVT